MGGGDKADGGGNNIRVAVRVRPFNGREAKELEKSGQPALCCFDLFRNSVVTKQMGNAFCFSEYTRPGRQFGFDEVFSSVDEKTGLEFATQETIFQTIGKPILDNALDAYNGCLLAYGQTGSGKSHSVLGDPTSETEKGLMPRACERLFQMVDDKRQEVEAAGSTMEANILACYLEIYQEKLHDLLVDKNNGSDLQVRLHKDLGPHVPGLTVTPVKNISEVHELLDFGAKNRVVGATSMNAMSSRSHAVFTLELRITLTIPGGTKDLQSKIKFVDLAGSEKQKKTGASGDRLQEGIAINQSLTTLSRVIQTLAKNREKEQPPFRESKLTLLLKDALSGNSRTVLLACISPATFNCEESISTLEFASRCKLIKTNAKKNEQDKAEMIESLQAEQKQLREALERSTWERQQVQQAFEQERRKINESLEKKQEQLDEESQQKLEVERQLQQLQEQIDAAAEAEDEALTRARLELEQRIRDHEELQLENDRVKREREQKARELAEQLGKQEQLEREQHHKSYEMERIRSEKERQVSEAERERQDAISELEESKRLQEEEQRRWVAKHEEEFRRARELEEQLAKQAEADSANRRQLEEEHEMLKANLAKQREEQDLRTEQAEQLRREREEQLSKVDLERNQFERQLQELREQQSAEQSRHEQFAAEKERQAEELKRLEEAAAQERERRKEIEERQKAFQDSKHVEIERLQREKEEQLQLKEQEHQDMRQALQDKLDALQLDEDQCRRKADANLAEETERRAVLQDEMRKRKVREANLEDQLASVSCLTESLELEKKDLETRWQEQRDRREKLLKELGIQGLENVGEDSHEVPRLVNMHPDPMLEGCLIYYLTKGSTRVGSAAEKCRICLSGLDVAEEVCDVENDENLSITVKALPGGFVRVNGEQVSEETATKLHDSDRLAIGRAHIFRVVIPKSHDTSKHRALEDEFSQAMNELRDKARLDNKWKSAVEEAVNVVKRDHGTEQANELLKKATRASDVVATANSLISKVPQNWTDEVSYYELAVLFEADGRKPTVCVVARSRDGGPEGGGPRTKGIWSAGTFEEERLPDMGQAAADIEMLRLLEGKDGGYPSPRNLKGQRVVTHHRETNLHDPTVEEWQSYAWSECSLSGYSELVAEYQDTKKLLAEAEEKLSRYEQDEERPWIHKIFGGWGTGHQPAPKEGGNSPVGEEPPPEQSGGLAWFGGLFGIGQQKNQPAPTEGQAKGCGRSRSTSQRKAPNKNSFNAPPAALQGIGSGPPSARNRSRSATNILGNGSSAGGGGPPTPSGSSPTAKAAVALRQAAWRARASLASPNASPGGSPNTASPPAHRRNTGIGPAGGDAPTQKRGSVMSLALADDKDEYSGAIVPRVAVAKEASLDLRVTELFGGKLGVSLYTPLPDVVKISKIEDFRAHKFGWRPEDRIQAVNGTPVANKKEFKDSLLPLLKSVEPPDETGQGRLRTPIVFTVTRLMKAEASPGGNRTTRPAAALGKDEQGQPPAPSRGAGAASTSGQPPVPSHRGAGAVSGGAPGANSAAPPLAAALPVAVPNLPAAAVQSKGREPPVAAVQTLPAKREMPPPPSATMSSLQRRMSMEGSSQSAAQPRGGSSQPAVAAQPQGSAGVSGNGQPAAAAQPRGSASVSGGSKPAGAGQPRGNASGPSPSAAQTRAVTSGDSPKPALRRTTSALSPSPSPSAAHMRAVTSGPPSVQSLRGGMSGDSPKPALRRTTSALSPSVTSDGPTARRRLSAGSETLRERGNHSLSKPRASTMVTTIPECAEDANYTMDKE